MAYRKFTADQLFDGYHLHTGKVLVTDESGRVEEVVPEDEAGGEVERLEGILTPGLINCHCHLELSHLNGVIPPQTGLVDFLCAVIAERNFTPDAIQAAMQRAGEELLHNGIVAVGDICNTADTAELKQNSRIRWHNFVEVLGLSEDVAESNFQRNRAVAAELDRRQPLAHHTTLAPHAPYSVAPGLLQLINAATEGQVITIHNQESPAEDELFRTGGGDFLRLFRQIGYSTSPLAVTGRSSIRSWLPHFNRGQTILLVHNTYMADEDIVWANAHAAEKGLHLVYCLCPLANRYIEDRLPPVERLVAHGCRLVLGTDSYASNRQLSIAAELQVLLQHTTLSLEELLRMATRNGARALRWDDALGSFEPGKQPGVVLLAPDAGSSRRVL
ncbi:MAG TPA: amidohydrolase family protein [Lacibacter sp.]|nr:amidohydrolase family protein [Lacibacter sp.]HMO88079.1 amidohydrolase family protein [Lacibacter sp.]HMP86465.1 amidohydrolase family protein [Lacibacter sp.]